jgi:hypothetical protein
VARRGPGWREPLIALWRELALVRGAGRRDKRGATRAAQEALRTAQTRLEALLEPGRPRGRSDLERCLGCAASALEGCVHVVVAHATGARRGHLHLLRRLDQRLADAELAVLRADGDYQVRSAQAAAAAERGALALQLFAGRSDDPSPAELECGLETLEDASLELAVLAIRAAMNVGAGHAPGGESDPSTQLVTRLDAQIDTLADAAETARAQARGAGRQASPMGWLSAALTAELPAGAARGARFAGPQFIADLRVAWLRLAGFELLVVEELDEAAPIRLFSNRDAIRETLTHTAGLLVHRTRLAARPHRFDHIAAWSRQREDLASAADTLARSRRRRAGTAEISVFSALERSAVALWTTDAQLHANAYDPAKERAK